VLLFRGIRNFRNQEVINTMRSTHKIQILNYGLPKAFEMNEELESIYSFEPQYKLRCPFCNTRLRGVGDEDHGHWRLLTFGCYGCGWWCQVEPSEISHWALTPAVLLEKSDTSILRSEEIARAILTQRELARRLPPKYFEEAVSATLNGLFDGKVKHVGSSYDGGIDIVGFDGKEKIVVQVKRRASSKAVEGVSVIRDFLGAMVLSESKCGMFITTADHFSRESIKASQKAVKLGAVTKLELVDSSKLSELLQLVWLEKYPPWERHI